jgi:XTP/dITP diphosphohydrolase
MADVADDLRNARFRCSIALVLPGVGEYVVEGISEGKILREKTGTGGFGYDPVFLPDGYRLSFAELPLEEKNKISHRGRALEKMKEKIIEIVKEKQGLHRLT